MDVPSTSGSLVVGFVRREGEVGSLPFAAVATSAMGDELAFTMPSAYATDALSDAFGIARTMGISLSLSLPFYEVR